MDDFDTQIQCEELEDDFFIIIERKSQFDFFKKICYNIYVLKKERKII